jgi:hypothetical protein
VINLPNAAAEHDGLDPLAALAIGQALTECAAVACHQRLSELVAIVTGAIGGIDEDLQRRCKALCKNASEWHRAGFMRRFPTPDSLHLSIRIKWHFCCPDSLADRKCHASAVD